MDVALQPRMFDVFREPAFLALRQCVAFCATPRNPFPGWNCPPPIFLSCPQTSIIFSAPDLFLFPLILVLSHHTRCLPPWVCTTLNSLRCNKSQSTPFVPTPRPPRGDLDFFGLPFSPVPPRACPRLFPYLPSLTWSSVLLSPRSIRGRDTPPAGVAPRLLLSTFSFRWRNCCHRPAPPEIPATLSCPPPIVARSTFPCSPDRSFVAFAIFFSSLVTQATHLATLFVPHSPPPSGQNPIFFFDVLLKKGVLSLNPPMVPSAVWSPHFSPDVSALAPFAPLQ